VNVDITDAFGKTPIDYSGEVSDTVIESLVRKLEGDLQHSVPSSQGDLLLRLADEERRDQDAASAAASQLDGAIDLPTPPRRRRSSGDRGKEILVAAAAAMASVMRSGTSSPRGGSGPATPTPQDLLEDISVAASLRSEPSSPLNGSAPDMSTDIRPFAISVAREPDQDQDVRLSINLENPDIADADEKT
jgi:hypothetical protein